MRQPLTFQIVQGHRGSLHTYIPTLKKMELQCGICAWSPFKELILECVSWGGESISKYTDSLIRFNLNQTNFRIVVVLDSTGKTVQ